MRINQHLPSDLNPTRVEVKRPSLGDMVAQYTQAESLSVLAKEKAAGKRLRALKGKRPVTKSIAECTVTVEYDEEEDPEYDGINTGPVGDKVDAAAVRANVSDSSQEGGQRGSYELSFNFDTMEDAAKFCGLLEDIGEVTNVTLTDPNGDEVDPSALDKSKRPVTKSDDAVFVVDVTFSSEDSDADTQEADLDDFASKWESYSSVDGEDGSYSIAFGSMNDAQEFADGLQQGDMAGHPMDAIGAPEEKSYAPKTKASSADLWDAAGTLMDNFGGDPDFSPGVSDAMDALNDAWINEDEAALADAISNLLSYEDELPAGLTEAANEVNSMLTNGVYHDSHKPKTKSNPSFDEPISIAEEWASEDSDLADTIQDFIDALEADDLEAAQAIFSESLKDSGSPYASRLEDALGSASEVAVGDDSDSDYA